MTKVTPGTPLVTAIVLLASGAPSDAAATVGAAEAPAAVPAVDARDEEVPADPRALARGRVYRTSAPAPFYETPRRGRPDRFLPASTVFRVEEILEKAPPWYGVTLLDADGRPEGRGYVDAADLVDQKIVELRPAGGGADGDGPREVRADPRGLEPEQSYRLAEPCPLVAEPAAAAPERMLPERSIVRVVEIREKAPPWYRVDVLDEDGAIARRGWIDAAVLLGSEVLHLTAPRDACELVGIESADTGATTRRIVRIRVPLGRRRPILEGTMLSAALTAAAETGAERVMVLAYLPHDDATGAHTVGRVIYAPGGQWDGPATGAPQPRVELGRAYFELSEWPVTVGPGDTVALTAPPGSTEVTMTREADPASDSVPVPAGMEITILSRRAVLRSPDDYDVRYRVRLQLGARRVEGWVDGESVERE